MIGTVLALAAALAAPIEAQPPGQVARPEVIAARPVPPEMTPAPGRWEVEDAPAYFSERRVFPEEAARDIARGAAAAGPEASDRRGDGSAGAPVPRSRDLAARAAPPRP